MKRETFVKVACALVEDCEDDTVAFIVPREWMVDLYQDAIAHNYFGCNIRGYQFIPHDSEDVLEFTWEDVETWKLFEHQQKCWGAAMHYYDHLTTELERKARNGGYRR